jgi:hypothetical protein
MCESSLAYISIITKKGEIMMKMPCAKRLSFIVCGLSFLQPALSLIQFENLTMIATALVLGSRFCLSDISRMWLSQKSISTLSYFMSDAKLSIPELQLLFLKQSLKVYHIKGGYFIIDDTMQHHSSFCKFIHGVFLLFDHVLNTNLRVVCIVTLYYSDGILIKFPIGFKIFYKSEGKRMPWQKHKVFIHKSKYDLAVELIEWALNAGFPKSVVLADSWYCVSPFIAELKRLNLRYVLEIKSTYNIKVKSKNPKLTPTGRLSKNQFDLLTLPEFFKSIPDIIKCGFTRDIETGKEEKVLYHLKVSTVQLNAIVGKHRIVESFDPAKQTVKYLLTNELTWESIKIISSYANRWVIEEFFRNAKQLLNMEGVTVRSEQGVTLALCLVFWIDFLLHLENHRQSIAGELPKESITIPSIVRMAEYENLEAVVERIKSDEVFLDTWFKEEKKNLVRKRRKRKDLVVIDQPSNNAKTDAAA